MSPLIAVSNHIALIRLIMLHTLYPGLSRREYVSINWRT